MRIAVLCASYNRVDKTLASLAALWAALERMGDIEARLFLLDDASPDGTAARVRAAYPTAMVIDGTGNLFWNRGMRAAYQAARGQGPWDAYLIFNDDTEFLQGGVAALFETFRKANAARPTACVGYLTDRAGTSRTYGGFRRADGLSPLSLLPVAVTSEDRPCDSFNGNFVLIPAGPMERADPFPQVYHHQYGDLDLGYALGRQGVAILECKDPVGRADRNPPIDLSTIGKRWKAVARPPHGLDQYAAFIRRNVPFPAWPILMSFGLAVRLLRVVTGMKS